MARARVLTVTGDMASPQVATSRQAATLEKTQINGIGLGQSDSDRYCIVTASVVVHCGSDFEHFPAHSSPMLHIVC